MNNDVGMMLGLMWVLMASSGIFLYKSVMVVQAYLETKRRRKIFASLEKATVENTCKGNHKWDDAKLALAGLEPGSYKVCVDCGQVAKGGSLRKLNGPAMEIYKNNIRLRGERQVKYKDLAQKRQQVTDEVMNRLVRAHVGELQGDLHANIAVLQQFFRKSSIEMEALYMDLHKDLEEIDRG